MSESRQTQKYNLCHVYVDAGAEDPAAIATELREAGIQVLVVGIGSGVNEKELSKIGGGSVNTFTADSFEQLLGVEFVEILESKACEIG